MTLHPYSGQDFFGFFGVLFSRLFSFLLRDSSLGKIASDEIQCLVLVFLSLSLAFLGVFLVLKRMTMLANALSHTILLGIVCVFLLTRLFFQEASFWDGSFASMKILWPAALISGLLTALLTQFLHHGLRVQEDASIGLVFTSLFALGVVLVTMYTKNMHLGVEAIMGNIDALDVQDVLATFEMALCNVGFHVLLFRPLSVSAFDPSFAKTLGFPTQKMHYLLMVLTAATAIVSFRAVGVLLFLALLVGPVLIAFRYTASLKKIIGLSFLISSLCSLVAVALSRHILSSYQIAISTSGLVVTLLLIVALISWGFSIKKGAFCKKMDPKNTNRAI